jgi:hypothetical protein
MKKSVLKMSLCEGRHPIPQAIDGAVFPGEIQDMRNTKELEDTAWASIWHAAYSHHVQGEQGFLALDPFWDGEDGAPYALDHRSLHLDLYVTGLTVALIACLNAMRQQQISVTLYHFDRETGEYYPQEVI